MDQLKVEIYTKPKTFIEGIRYTDISDLVSNVNGMDYLAWPTAIALAGRPKLDVVSFDSMPFLSFFGGGAVAVEGFSGERKQRIWLPIMDNKHKSISQGKIDVRDINDSLSRCRAKAVAMLHGVGLSLYAEYGGNSIGFLKNLGVKPDSDLSQVEPLTAKKPGKAPASYVDWVAAYTAAKLTDPEFYFEVLDFNNIDMETGEEKLIPAQQVGSSWMVAVKLIHKGQEHIEWLPVMGTKEVQTKNGLKKMDHQPLDNPTTHDWNRAVMRCLTRGIAVLTGYGLSVYAKEDYILLMSMNNNDDVVVNEKPQLKIVESTKQAPEVSDKSETPVFFGEVDEEVPEDHFLYFDPNAALKLKEPDEDTRKRILVQIGSISSIENLKTFKAKIDSDYADTMAYEIFISALRGKRNELLAPVDDATVQEHVTENSVNEPSEQIKLKMINRIGAIRSLDSISVAKQQIDEDYAGTLAHAEFLRALSAKRDQLREADLAAA